MLHCTVYKLCSVLASYLYCIFARLDNRFDFHLNNAMVLLMLFVTTIFDFRRKFGSPMANINVSKVSHLKFDCVGTR